MNGETNQNQLSTRVKSNRIDYEIEINSIHDSGISAIADELIENETFDKQSIDRCLEIIKRRFAISIARNRIKIGRGGSHIWFAEPETNSRIAIIYFKES